MLARLKAAGPKGTWRKALLTCGAVATIALSPTGALRAAGVSIASLPTIDNHTHVLQPPSVLGPDDSDRYRRIFELQSRARWEDADALIARLNDPVLLGSVLAQRYLSRAFPTTFQQGRDWLARFSDQPEAAAISERALGRTGPGADGVSSASSHLKQPSSQVSRDGTAILVDGAAALARFPRLVRSAIQERRWKLAMTEWQAGRYEDAGRIFEQLGRSEDTGYWTQSAASYWAARAQSAMGRPGLATFWLSVAARSPRTFYGLLARRELGLDPDFNFAQPFSAPSLAALLKVPGGRRALALLQIGRDAQAKDELSLLAAHATPALAAALLALGEAANLPGIELQTSAIALAPDGRRLDNGLYPLPHWVPAGGYTIDRGLLFSIMMQESFFTPDVSNPSGAIGLMQVMPETARTMVALYDLPVAPSNLQDPVTNLTIAQAYVDYLMHADSVRGNLVMLGIAYNCGVGALAHYQGARFKTIDPLLFMEELPVGTRGFVQRLLTNLSIYRLRLGQTPAELDALAAGRWPIYVPSDPPYFDGSRSEGLRDAAN